MGNNIVEHTLNKVVFLDRDGTLNEEVNYLSLIHIFFRIAGV